MSGRAVISSLARPAWPARLIRGGLGFLVGGLLIAALAGPLHRGRIIANYGVALSVLAAGFVSIMVGTLLTVVGLLQAAANRVPTPNRVAAAGVVVGLAATGYLLCLVARARSVLPIHDISTDMGDPPVFVAVAQIRKRLQGVNPSEYSAEFAASGGTIKVAELQHSAYPDIKPLQLAMTPAAALNRARRAVERLGWQVVADVPAEGRLEATDTTAFMGLKDDIVVRVRPDDGGARVDVRLRVPGGIQRRGGERRAGSRVLEANGKRMKSWHALSLS